MNLWKAWKLGVGYSLAALAGMLAAGCGPAANPARDSAQPATPVTAADDHSGWWCREHGVPEEDCALCNAKVAAQYKLKGDWCKEHNRPESQCFLCDPKRAERFAALYEAKYGTKPPRPE